MEPRLVRARSMTVGSKTIGDRCGAQIPIRRVYSIDKSPARRSCWNDGGGVRRVLRLLILAIAAIFRPKALLIAENLCLRQQLVVLQRRHPRPRLRDADQMLLDPGTPMFH